MVGSGDFLFTRRSFGEGGAKAGVKGEDEGIEK